MKSYPVQYLKLDNGETMAYRECGDPALPELVLLHGNQSSGAFFEETMNAIKFLVWGPVSLLYLAKARFRTRA